MVTLPFPFFPDALEATMPQGTPLSLCLFLFPGIPLTCAADASAALGPLPGAMSDKGPSAYSKRETAKTNRDTTCSTPETKETTAK